MSFSPPSPTTPRSGVLELPDYPIGPLSLLVVQPTPFCNIDCDYCYLPTRNLRGVIQPETLDKLFRSVFASSIVRDGFSLVWHAGEPLVLPIAFYERANACLARHNACRLPVRVCFQTNGMLVTDAWCEFFIESGARVGVSLDGPQELHDRHRKTRGKRGTFDRVMAGVRRLQRAGVAFSVICVLTRESLLQPRRIFSFFAEEGITNVGFNVEELEGDHTVDVDRLRGGARALLSVHGGDHFAAREQRHPCARARYLRRLPEVRPADGDRPAMHAIAHHICGL